MTCEPPAGFTDELKYTLLNDQKIKINAEIKLDPRRSELTSYKFQKRILIYVNVISSKSNITKYITYIEPKNSKPHLQKFLSYPYP